MDTNRTTAEVAAVDRLITISSAQQQLGVSRSKLYKMLDANEIPRPIKIGRRAFFSEREIQTWISDQLAMRANGGA